jgi:hypothetical protein
VWHRSCPPIAQVQIGSIRTRTINHVVPMLLNELHQIGNGRASSAAKKPMQSSTSHSPGAAPGSPAPAPQPTPIITGHPRSGAGVDLGVLHLAAQRVTVMPHNSPTRRHSEQCANAGPPRQSPTVAAGHRPRDHRPNGPPDHQPQAGASSGTDITPPFGGISASTKAEVVHEGDRAVLVTADRHKIVSIPS